MAMSSKEPSYGERERERERGILRPVEFHARAGGIETTRSTSAHRPPQAKAADERAPAPGPMTRNTVPQLRCCAETPGGDDPAGS